MRIVNPFCVLQFAYQPYGQYGIQVDTAKGICFLKKKVKEQAYVIFGIKPRTGIKETGEALLPVGPPGERGRGRSFDTNQFNHIPSLSQCAADPYHALVMIQVVGYRKYYFFQITLFLGPKAC